GEGEHAEEATGKVTFIGSQGQGATGTCAGKVRYPTPAPNPHANTLRQTPGPTPAKGDCLTIPGAALLADPVPPAAPAAVPSTDDGGEEEFKAHEYLVVVGVRDGEKHRVEVQALRDPETKKDAAADPHLLFITEGGHGLEDGDLVKKAEEHEEHKEGEE